MALRKIRTGSDPVLRKICKPVGAVNQSILTLIDDMADTMYNAEGVGLAAPQVGVLRRVVVVDVGDGLVELINPQIIQSSGVQLGPEGCLSIPGASANVERPSYVKVKALNRNGEEVIVEGKDFMARAICHELDHLDGILYIDKAVSEIEY